MALLKYKDPADGLWKPVPVGGSAGAAPAAGAGLTGGVTSYEVGAGTGVTVAADTVSLDKAYTDTLYSPTTHVHALNDLTDADTVVSAPAVGDALVWDGTAWVPSGPAVVVPPAPTLITQAARWADGIPRFATVAERDAAYATIGGPVAGMRCDVEGFSQKYYNIPGLIAWANTLNSNSSALPNQSVTSGSSVQFSQGTNSVQHPNWLFTHTESSDYIRAPVSGIYMIRATISLAGANGGVIQIGVSGATTYLTTNFVASTSWSWAYLSGQHYLTGGNYVQVLLPTVTTATTVTEGSLSMTLMNP